MPIRVSWGCNNNCSYCGIRSAVGRLHSKPLETCRNELLEGLGKGLTDFEIIADDVGAYGLDIGLTFPDLLNVLCDVQGDYDLRVWNLSPVWLVRYLAELIPSFQNGKILEVHCPVQSGSSGILKAMNRYSNVVEIGNAIGKLRSVAPQLRLTTDIILGFPGETEADVEKTIEFIRSTRFRMIDIFIYYDGRNTPASRMQDKISPSLVEQRLRKIRRALESMNMDYQVS